MNGYLVFILIIFGARALPASIAGIIAGIVVARNVASRALGTLAAGGTAVLGLWVLTLMALWRAELLSVAILPLWGIFLAPLSVPVFIIAAIGGWIAHRRPSRAPEGRTLA